MLDTVMTPEATVQPATYLGLGRLYQFFELALAHPAEGLREFLIASETAEGFAQAVAAAVLDQEKRDGICEAFEGFTAAARLCDAETLEAQHIALFASNYPSVPCPPYSSLFTTEEGRRLEEMVAIKQEYAQAGFFLSSKFDDFPDHICAELEFLQALCFSQTENAARSAETEAVREVLLRFLGRHFTPFVARLAAIAGREMPASAYSYMLDALSRISAAHLANDRTTD